MLVPSKINRTITNQISSESSNCSSEERRSDNGRIVHNKNAVIALNKYANRARQYTVFSETVLPINNVTATLVQRSQTPRLAEKASVVGAFVGAGLGILTACLLLHAIEDPEEVTEINRNHFDDRKMYYAIGLFVLAPVILGCAFSRIFAKAFPAIASDIQECRGTEPMSEEI